MILLKDLILVLESLLYAFKKLLTVCLILFSKLFKSKVLHALRPQGLPLVRLILGLCSRSLIHWAFLCTCAFVSRGFSSVSVIAACHLNGSASGRLLSVKLYSLVCRWPWSSFQRSYVSGSVCMPWSSFWRSYVLGSVCMPWSSFQRSYYVWDWYPFNSFTRMEDGWA